MDISINFFPYYEPYLRKGLKTTTFRLGKHQPFQKGQEVVVTVGWKESTASKIGLARIIEVYSRRIKDLSEPDFEGESPDCMTSETAKLVLGSIYRVVLSEEDNIWVVKFKHVVNKVPPCS